MIKLKNNLKEFYKKNKFWIRVLLIVIVLFGGGGGDDTGGLVLQNFYNYLQNQNMYSF